MPLLCGIFRGDPLPFLFLQDVQGVPAVTKHGHQVAFGILASRKSLLGPGNKYPLRYPAPVDLYKAAAARGALNIVHYSAEDSEGLGAALVYAVRLVEQDGGPHVHGVQVNVPMPDRAELEKFARIYPQKRVVLQVGEKALRWSAHNASTLCLNLTQYAWVVTDVLLDGRVEGKPMDPTMLAYYVAAIHTFAPHLGIGVAGGLCAETMVGTTAELLEAFPNLSVCAEGALRDDAPGGGRLVLDKARAYVLRAREVFDGGKPPAQAN
jgi:hypothetical protein